MAKDLGVRYVLEGSVQKSGDRIRVTAQLIDAVNDNHLLSQKYDRNLTDLFALEDDLTLQIAGALDVQLSGGDIGPQLRSWHAQPRSLGEPRKSEPSLLSLQPRRRERGAEAAQRAVDLDPNYVVAWQLLAFTYFRSGGFGLGTRSDRGARPRPAAR